MRNYQEIEDHVINKLKKELPKELYYHGVHHTLDVLKAATMIAKDENISESDLFLLKVAVLYHDAGFIKVYKNHEELGCQLALQELPGFGLDERELGIVLGMIMATKIPQQPKTQLEKIIADADLEYLGTDRFEEVGRTLFEEIKIFLDVESERQWNIIQMNFLKNHHYFTSFCRKNREAQKQAHLGIIEKIVATYD